MRLTDSQRAAVEHRGSNLLVSASAGSGKTEVLAQRCLALIADAKRPCDVDRLLVVTFTRAAAAELRIRIARMLRAAADASADVAQRRHLGLQELRVGGAEIGTIDAWCGRVVREHFAAAGVDLDFVVLGEQEALLLRRELLDELLRAVCNESDVRHADARGWLQRAAVPGDDFLRALVGGLNRFREHLVNTESWFARQRAPRAPDHAEQVLGAALAEECRFQAAQLTAMLAAERAGAAAVLAPYCDQLAAWVHALAAPGALRAVAAEIDAFRLPRSKRGVPEPAIVAEVRERWLKKRLQEAWAHDQVAAVLDHQAAAAELVAMLLRLEERYHQMLTEAKRARAAYEFGDVLRMTLDLLGTPGDGPQRAATPIAERLQRRYEHILVDEYQDTSPVQVEILRLVTRPGRGAGNRFMVGDVKQSIYGFRHAEPRLFAALADALETGRAAGRVRYLADNFRSHERLLAGLNGLFANLFDRDLGGTRFGTDERLRAGRAELPNPNLAACARIEVHVVEADRHADHGEAEDLLAVERIEREAQLAARQIHALRASGMLVLERRGGDEVALRPVRLSDIVVLLRSARQNAGLVARVLRDHGIPCLASGREALLDAPEVRDLCNVLALLVNRRQDVPLAAYLRGPLVGLSCGELLAIRSAAPAGSDFLDAVEGCAAGGADQALRQRLADALARLDRWAAVAREQEVPALLQRILREGGLMLFAQALPGGQQRVALLRALHTAAVAFAASGRATADFVAYLEALAAEEIDPGALAAADEDVVRIMTIHGAKGLEHPVVFLLGAGAAFNRQSQQAGLLCDADHGLGVRFRDYSRRASITTAEHLVVRRQIARRELEEELRLLYVAATRARERLVIIGHALPGAWDECRAQHSAAGLPPLISRLSVASVLEWVLMAVAAGGLHEARAGAPPLVRVVTHDRSEAGSAGSDNTPPLPPRAATGGGSELPPSRQELPSHPDEAEGGLSAQDDAAWEARAEFLLGAGADHRWAELPAVLSVSAAKELARRDPASDQPPALGEQPGEPLCPPAFAAPDTGDGRLIGTACHRFLQHADLARLTDAGAVEAQVGALVAGGRLSAAEAALVPVADLVWLAHTAEGKLLARPPGVLHRELPFVYALPLAGGSEHTVIRGVIDSLVETQEGLVIFDYKTDRPQDAPDLTARLAAYGVQLQLYAQAVEAIFGRPVVRRSLLFLGARRVVDVPPPAGPLAERLVAALHVT